MYLDSLVQKGLIFYLNGYYSTENNYHLVERRLEGNKKARAIMHKAMKNGRLIAKFPFVRSVYISGSLSKDYIDKDSDIDYLVIAHKGRLWICRTLLILYKKLFLFNSYKYFCLNYFIDEVHTEIEDKDIFTATELMTLIPVYNQEGADKIIDSNNWVRDYYAHFPLTSAYKMNNIHSTSLKKFVEFIFSNKAGDIVDDLCMRITKSFLRWKLSTSNNLDAVNLQKYVAKYHRNDFRHYVLKRYQNKIDEYLVSNHVSLI